MGHKVHPVAFRLPRVIGWASRWFSKKNYKNQLKEDYLLREFVVDKLKGMGVERVEIEISANIIKIIIKTSKPGFIIGRGGTGVEDLKTSIKSYFKKIKGHINDKELPNINLDIQEVRKIETKAALVAQAIVQDIEKRIPFRRVLKRTLENLLQNKDIKGVKLMVSGRLDGAEMARVQYLKWGSIPLGTIRSYIDYAYTTAYTTYGTIGVKVWIYKGEVFADELH